MYTYGHRPVSDFEGIDKKPPPQARKAVGGGGSFDTLITLPVVLPPTVLGYYLLVLFGRQSSIGTFLEDRFDITIVFTPAGAVMAALVVSIPFLIKSARSAFAGIDPTLLHAARILGRTEWNIFVTIIISLARRPIFSST